MNQVTNTQKSSDTQETKKSKIINVGLEFKEKPFRKWLKEHYSRQDKSFNFKNSHYVLATVNQILTFNLLNGMSEYLKKTNHGFYDVKLDDMITYIKLTPFLNQTYNFIISRYDEHMDYQKQLCIDKKVFDEYITKNVFHDNFRINLNKQSMNFLTYILVQTNILLANTGKQLAIFGNKKSISDLAIIHSLNIHFTGKLLDDILKKYDSVSTLLKNKEKDDSEKGEKNDEDKEEKNNEDKEEKHKDNVNDENSDDDKEEKHNDNDNDNSDDDKEEKHKDKDCESKSESEDEKENEKSDSESVSESESETESEVVKKPVGKLNQSQSKSVKTKPEEKPKKIVKKK
jgi:hypothetical protein